jgi:predicted metal-dependent phosphoesterase TrpH
VSGALLAGALNIDLHTHSNCSDGSLTPTELIERAAGAGVEVLALTDHDTVAGLPDAQRAAAAQGLRLVPGVEISASWRAQAIHVLGLWIDPASPELRRLLDAQGERRRERMRKICARLGKLKLPSAQLLAAVEMQPGLPTRAHLAQALVAGGHAVSAEAAFRKYLGKGKAAHIAADWPDLEEVVGWIRRAGGVASLAHPTRYALSSGARRRLLADFKAAGGTVLEVVTGANGAQHADTCAALAVAYGLQGSVGSDFHNSQAAWNPLGRSLKLPDCVTPVWRSFGL